ncbi:MAG: type IV pilin protein [Methylococcaceae bacterium]
MTQKQNGFTLIELMIVVAIIGILTSVAYPSYVKYIQKSKRSEAQAALLSMATAMEQWRVENNNDYTGVATSDITTSSTKNYTFSLSSDKTTYTLTAIPASPQDEDDCGVLSLDSKGVKGAKKATDDISDCWE